MIQPQHQQPAPPPERRNPVSAAELETTWLATEQLTLTFNAMTLNDGISTPSMTCS